MLVKVQITDVYKCIWTCLLVRVCVCLCAFACVFVLVCLRVRVYLYVYLHVCTRKYRWVIYNNLNSKQTKQKYVIYKFN